MKEGMKPPALAPVAAVPPSPNIVTRTGRGLLDLLFPPRCVICRQTGSSFCAVCLARVQPVGEEARSTLREGGGFPASALRSAGVYAPPLSLAIRQFKYRGRTDLAGSLGGLMASYWQSCSIHVDLVAAVPLHEKRLRERGYNQAELLAVELCRAARLPLLSPDMLSRKRDTEHQVRLGPEERRRNVAGAFVWNGPPLSGSTVLLVDDVATTGSTLEACAEVLMHSGASHVWALTAARALARAGEDRLRGGSMS